MSMHALFGGPTPEVVKAKLFSLMTEHGATRLQAEYSGGNDEGGIQDTIKLFKGDEEIAAPEMWNTRKPAKGETVYSRDGLVYEYHPLYEAADDVLSLEFGSWAGEFSAYGTFYADATQRKAWREGSVDTPTDDSEDF